MVSKRAVAVIMAAAFLAGCSGNGGETPPAPASVEPTDTASSEPAALTEEEIRAANVEAGYEEIADHYADLDSIRRGGFSDETLISQLLDSVGANYRRQTDLYIESGQAQRWSQTGSYRVVPMGEQDYTQEDGYLQMVLRTCLDVSDVEFFVDGEAIETEDHVIDYTLYISDGSPDDPRIDGGSAVEDVTCPANP